MVYQPRARKPYAAIVAVRSDQLAVGVECHLEHHFCLARLVGGDQVLVAILDPLQRPTEFERGEDHRDFFLPWVILEAECSADILGDHADRGLRQSECERGPARHHVRTLACDVERQFLAAVADGHDPTRLHRRLRDALMNDFVGDEVRCTFKQRVEILVDRFLAHLRSDVVVGAGVDWRPAPRVVDCDDRIFLRVLDLNQRGPILGDMAAVGDDEGHRFADIGHPPVGQRGYFHLRRDEEKIHHVDLEAGQVFLSVDGVYAGNFARPHRIDREDSGPRDGAAGEGDMHHARHHDVVDKLAAAGQQAWIFLAANALAYVAPGAGIGVGLGVGGDLRVGRGDGAHDFPLAAPASFFAARRIP